MAIAVVSQVGNGALLSVLRAGARRRWCRRVCTLDARAGSGERPILRCRPPPHEPKPNDEAATPNPATQGAYSIYEPGSDRSLDGEAAACQSRRVKSCGPTGSQDLAFKEIDLLTMERRRQMVAAGGNGFGLFSRLWAPGHLPPVATDCDHGAPQRLQLHSVKLAAGRSGFAQRLERLAPLPLKVPRRGAAAARSGCCCRASCRSAEPSSVRRSAPPLRGPRGRTPGRGPG